VLSAEKNSSKFLVVSYEFGSVRMSSREARDFCPDAYNLIAYRLGGQAGHGIGGSPPLK